MNPQIANPNGFDLRWIAVIIATLALALVVYNIRNLLRQDAGDGRITELGTAVRQGATAFLKLEYRVMAVFVAVMAIVLGLLIPPQPWVALSYVIGTLVAAFAGFIGMSVAVRANVRTAVAAKSSWAKALRLAYSSGAATGLAGIAMGLLGLSLVSFITDDANVLLGFVFGATSVALFLRVGGGIYTKSADVGADLVGKVEMHIPEDDPRNPAVIADQVGDNVGDIAGMGSDLYESYIAAIVAAMVLGGTVYGMDGIVLPLLLGATGLVASIFGTLFVRSGEASDDYGEQVSLAHRTMNRGVLASSVFLVVVAFVVVLLYMGVGELNLFFAFLVGLLTGASIGPITEYYTSTHKPVLRIAELSQTGPAINIMEGMSVGMMSTVIPIVIIAAATVIAFQLADLLGIALASVGMIANMGMLLSMDFYGPIADNAAGIAEMADMGQVVRERCEALDAVGNTTAAVGKGFAISSAALATLAWLATYFRIAGIEVASITAVDVVAGLFVGGMMIFLFCALTQAGVSAGAFEIVSEVRRQFREIPGLLEGTTPPDYVACVAIATRRALRAMLLPGLLVIAIPLLTGILLGPTSVAGVLLGSLIVGLPMAIFMANSGGAWDNAKKHIEAGHFGGKNSPAHEAAVIGDTVGDPFKDTLGPALDILMKLVGMMAVLFAPLFAFALLAL